jgi:hypothetical protein
VPALQEIIASHSSIPLRRLLAHLAGILVITLAGLILTSCTTAPSGVRDEAGIILAEAAAQATAMIQQAEATALAVQARAEATALLAQAQMQATSISAGASQTKHPLDTPQPASQNTRLTSEAASTPPPPGGTATQVDMPEQTPAPALSGYAAVQATFGPDAVQLLKVSLAANNQYIYIQYLAPPELAFYWNQTVVSVEDLETGLVYAEVPFMPLIGPLFNKPAHPGQPGYVMILNLPTPLDFGAHVKVRLANYEWEDVIVEE